MVKMTVQTRRPKWFAPAESCMKINVDATIFKNMGRASDAAVARDQTWELQVWYWKI
jgi:hypothetical protein